MPFSRLPLLARNAGALLAHKPPLTAYMVAAALATTGTAFIYWPAALLVLAAFVLALVAVP